MISTVAGISLVQSWNDYGRYTDIARLASLDKFYFEALLALRQERGAWDQLLLVEPEKLGKVLETAKSMQSDVVKAMNSAEPLYAGIADPDLKSMIGNIKSTNDDIINLRKDIITALSTPVSQRDQALKTRWMTLSGNLVNSLDQGEITLEDKIRTLDPTTVSLIQIRRSAWNARVGIGETSLILNAALASGKPFTRQEIAQLDSFDSRADAFWDIVGSTIKHPSTPPSVRVAYQKGQDGFYADAFQQYRQSVIDALSSGKPSPVPFAEFRPKNTAAQGSVALVAAAAMEELVKFSMSAKAHALNTFLLYALAFVFAAGIAVAGMVVIVFRVARPLGRLTSCMNSLAGGQNDMIVPDIERHDEIGGMARSVEVFRKAAIRNQELEIEAEQNRRKADLERAEVQRLAEAEADERLQRATGRLAEGLQRLAAGDMLCEIHDQFAPQFEALRHDFNQSVTQLRSVLVMVAAASSNVRGGSGEISNASDSLAKRTEQQAASLEQTAAALEEITSNVHATTKRTSEARDQVRNTRNRAEQSAAVVNKAVDAMGRIEQASNQISQIIGVIDEIAFQTNLLALNAGVEAARAGEAGKGFAVVAQEVRELAQRSASAAKDIKGLINNSEAAVSEGVKLVNDTGEGLTMIADLVQSINQHMEAIATAAQEQSSGLGEVNTAVNHMDQATQQNAAMVEEMNAAGTGLAQEAAKLSDLLSRFKTGAAEAEAPRQRPAVATARATRPAPRVSGNTALKTEGWSEF
ncbi:methyl-accepting chemotaxis protein [Allorhizobium sp. BGMRC 0089]|uniref:methyl-accepting chemotaxis protein n=1 Tax=Allorhizobium sonneratiae TaxID=2934936 RepID=UPI002033F83B|nr:methyl-accepting chemotaxis protein [Allorhizobium sonneratiae]MCM2294189.1 methyl-accepting chemotaxis protein [Allorhizobium sonneratiae]